MAITYVGFAVTPTDGVGLDDSVERSITPVPGMVAGDLCILYAARKLAANIVQNQLGGQGWTAGTVRQGGSFAARIFWCTFNGTWSANPSIASVGDSTVTITLFMDVFRPTVGTNTWAIDVAESFHTYSAPVSPFDVTITGQTSLAANTVTVARWMSVDVNTWQLRTAGWANSGIAQYRNSAAPPAKDISISSAYKIQTAAGATGNVVNRQLTLGGDPGLNLITTFKEQGAGVTVSSVTPSTFSDGQTGIVIAGNSFGAAHSGSADVIVSPTNNIADGAAVVQTQTVWSDPSVTITAVAGSFTSFTNLFLFVRNSAGQSNSSGFVVQRQAVANITAVLKNLAGTAQINLTNVRYRVTAVTINGTVLLSGTTGTTDGSGNFLLGPYTLTSGGPLSVGDDVWVTAAVDGVSQAVSFATCVKVTPTYT